MKSFIEFGYIFSFATMVLGLATAVIPSTDGIYNSHIMGIILFLLGLQTFAVTRRVIDKSGK